MTPEETRTGTTGRDLLLACGILSSLLYVATDISAALRWDEYSYAAQGISELSAIGAPTRNFVVRRFLVYAVLATAFGAGVLLASGTRRALRVTGWLLVGHGVLDLVAPFFPMHQRGAPGSVTDTMHLILTAATVVVTLLYIGFGAAALGRRFRAYSIATLVLLLVFESSRSSTLHASPRASRRPGWG